MIRAMGGEWTGKEWGQGEEKAGGKGVVPCGGGGESRGERGGMEGGDGDGRAVVPALQLSRHSGFALRGW